MRTKELVKFIKERESIRLKKEAGKPRPWTKDPILDKYRFCNVHREDDRVTRELKALAPTGDPNLWFWWVMARLFNKPSTMKALAGMRYMGKLTFNHEQMRKTLKFLRESGPIFNGAYIVSTNGVAMDKVDYIIDRVLKPLWAARAALRPMDGIRLETYHTCLMRFDGLGSFIAAQVVADMKYAAPLDKAEDWHTWAAPGPGSRRGLNVVFDRDMETPWSGNTWFEHLRILHLAVGKAGLQMHAQDLQNCLCEYSKYYKALTGIGKPKQLYNEKTVETR